MMISPSEACRRIATWLSPELISAAAWDRVFRTTWGLPEAIFCASLECRLSGDDSRVDLLVCVRAEDGRAVLSRRPERLQGPGWERIFEFCDEWGRFPPTVLAEVPFIWLEFDVPESWTKPVPPFPFFCLQPHFTPEFKDPRSPRARPSRELPWRIARRALSLSRGGPLTLGRECALATCFEQLPPEAFALHIAPLESRGREAARLVLSLPREEVRTYLERIGWRGAWGTVDEVLEDLHRHSSRIGLQLDVGEGVEDALGIQFYFQGNDTRWNPLLKALVERGVCTPAKRDALLSWPGEEEVMLDGRNWPVLLRRELELKLVCRTGQFVEAKAYLGFGVDFLLFERKAGPLGGAYAVRTQ